MVEKHSLRVQTVGCYGSLGERLLGNATGGDLLTIKKLLIGVGAVVAVAIAAGLVIWLVGMGGGDSPAGQDEAPIADAAPTSEPAQPGRETPASGAEDAQPPQLTYAKPVPEDGWVKWEDTELMVAEDQLIIVPESGATREQVLGALGKIGGSIVGEIPSVEIYQAEVPSGLALRQAIDQLEQSTAVKIASPNFQSQNSQSGDGTRITPNDPGFDKQTYLKEIRVDEAWAILERYVREIRGDEGWIIHDLSSEVGIAIVDTGIRTLSIEEDNLELRVIERYDMSTGLGETIPDDYHGTCVASVAAAIPDNGIGIAGVAWNSSLIDVKNESGTFGMFAGIEQAIELGAKVINVSSAGWAETPVVEELRRIVRKAGDNGALIVAATSNEHSWQDDLAWLLMHKQLPASYAIDHNNVISVGGIEDGRLKMGFYSRITVGAPPTVLDCESSDPEYRDTIEGTSYVAPQISGLAALIWAMDYEANGEFTLTPARVREIMGETAHNPDDLITIGAGTIDAAAALERTAETLGMSVRPPESTPPPTEPTPPPKRTPVPTTAPMVQPTPASGTLVTGTILFNGRPLRITDIDFTIWISKRGTDSYLATDMMLYDPSTGEYEIQIGGVLSNGFEVGFYVDISAPFDRERSSSALDLLGWTSSEAPQGQTHFRVDINLREIIHMTRPVDNSSGLTILQGFDIYPAGAMRIAWDPIEEADSYEVRIDATDGDHEYREIFNETIAVTSLLVDIPVSDADEWYMLSVYAYKPDGQVVGQIVSEQEGRFVSHYKFRIEGPEGPEPTPTPQPTPPQGPYAYVSAGLDHACGVTTSGNALCWGVNYYGPATPPAGVSFVSVSAGGEHTCGVTTSGDALCWGENDYGQATPPAGLPFAFVNAGWVHTCGVTTSDDALCWGLGYYAQTTLPAGVSFASVSAGYYNTCGVTTSGDALCWGDGPFGGPRRTPAYPFTSVSTGGIHACGVTTSGNVLCWGKDYYYGQATLPFDSVSTGDLLWRARLGAVYASPTIVGDMAYVGAYDGGVYALDALTGEVVWRYQTGRDDLKFSPTVADGIAYIGSPDHHVYALDASTGSLLWRYKAESDVRTRPSVADGLVYFVSYDGYLYALDAMLGELRWRYNTDSEWAEDSPVVSNGVVYFSSDDRHLYALDALTGELRWRYDTDGGTSPTVSDGVLYVSSSDLYALDASTGELRWRYDTDGSPIASPTVSGDLVYVGTFDRHVYAVDASTGHLLWRYEMVDRYNYPTAVAGVVYVGSRDGWVYALDAATRELRWRYQTGDEIRSSLTVSDGIVYVGSRDGHVYALRASERQ